MRWSKWCWWPFVWWVGLPITQCRNCGWWFLRHFPWSFAEETCCKTCNDELMYLELGPPNE